MSLLRKTSTGFLKTVLRITIYIILIIALYYLASTAYAYGHKVFSDEGVSEAPGTDITLVIDEGTSVMNLGRILQEYEVIEDYKIFYLQSIIYEVSEVTPGTYTFNDSQSGEDILDIVKEGPNGEGTEDDTEE